MSDAPPLLYWIDVSDRMAARGWSPTAYTLARKAGITEPTAQRILDREEVRRIDVAVAHAVAPLFRLAWHGLFTDEPPPARKRKPT